MYLREKDFFELFKVEKKHREHLQLIVTNIEDKSYEPVYVINFQLKSGESVFLRSARKERRKFKTITAIENCIKRNLNKLNFQDIRYVA